MSIKINGEKIESTFEIWSVKQFSTDGESREIAFPSEDEARLEHGLYGGTLLVRNAYAGFPRELVGHPVPLEDLNV